VKHFSWKPQGKRRLHQKPRDGEIAACQPWLTHELDLIRPEILVCLGATAARSVFGKIMKIESERGRFQRSSYCEKTLITYHPSAALRAFNEEARLAIRDKLMEDLKKCAGALA
jgi:DNA polymerase